MNKITIIGNVCAKPELRYTQTNKAVCSFTVAVNRRRQAGQENPETDFFRVSAWEKQAEICVKYLDKGSKVAVIGAVSCRTYQANNGETRASLEVQAHEIEFLTRAADQAEQQYMQQERAAIQQESSGEFTQVETDDLPF
jgi:single-strand DNA-binding protein